MRHALGQGTQQGTPDQVISDSPAIAIIGGDCQEGSIAGPGQVCDCLKVQSTQHSYWSWLLHTCIKSVMADKQWDLHVRLGASSYA